MTSRDPRQALGQRGEAEAEQFLKGLGYRIVGRRERVLRGDIDLVALDGRTVVFVEVRSRTRAEQVSTISPAGIGSTTTVAVGTETDTRTPRPRRW